MNLPFDINLKGKVAVVTGGGGVLCRMFSIALAQSGAKVAVLDLDLQKAQRVSREISDLGYEAIGVSADVLSKESLIEARTLINNKLGKCDILINGAGGNHPNGTTSTEYYSKGDELNDDIVSFFDLDTKGVQFVFNLNFVGTLLPTQVFASDMVGKEDCTVINISSMNAFTPLTKIPAYSGAKAAISNFTQWLAVHMSRENIRVNAIAPGFFVTAQNEKLLYDASGEITERGNKIVSNTPMNRFGKPEELIGTLLWLVDNRSSGFVNGTIIPVDGGFSAYSGV